YAQANNKVLCFLNQDAVTRPDVIFVSSRRIAHRWRSAAHENGCTPVVMIKERPIISDEVSRVLYRTD
ncbi:helix-turn-helix transcriptional regulator, partial [Morganella morganii]|nr:helix-turn-helix transcriptional regulator [Morganella morganii]